MRQLKSKTSINSLMKQRLEQKLLVASATTKLEKMQAIETPAMAIERAWQ